MGIMTFYSAYKNDFSIELKIHFFQPFKGTTLLF